MIRRSLLSGSISLVLASLALGCSQPAEKGNTYDSNGDHVADDLGRTVDADRDGIADLFDINNDGVPDGIGVDYEPRDGVPDSIGLDTNCDGDIDSLDRDGDGVADLITSRLPGITGGRDCNAPAATGGTTGSGGTTGTGGDTGTGSTGTGGTTGPSMLGSATYQGGGTTTNQYAEADVYRNGVGYKFIANGWGSGWQSHNISWQGTSFTVNSLNGSQGANYSPAGYPTMFCGYYSEKQSSGGCGLPTAISSLTSVKTGWRWKANGNNGQYNAAWDIWLGSGSSLQSYLMVWLRWPDGQQPAGSASLANVSVPGVPGTWSVWTGQVNGRPIVNYVKPRGADLSELEFDVLSFYNHAKERGFNLPGSDLLAVAIGFEIWNGPVTNLQTEDFYVDVQ